MLRKIFLRLIFCGGALMGVVVLSGCLAGYLAFQQPAFYAALRGQQFSNIELQEATAHFEHMERDLRLWNERSLALQARPAPDSPAPARADPKPPRNDYDPAKDTRSITVTEQQINAQLAALKTGDRGEWRHPRVRIRPDFVDVAFEVVLPQASCVVSAELKPALAPDGRLRLELTAARIGRLPLPLSTILQLLPRDLELPEDDMEVDLTPPTPHVCLDVTDGDPRCPAVKSIKCAEGVITIEFHAPVLNARPLAPPLGALSLVARRLTNAEVRETASPGGA